MLNWFRKKKNKPLSLEDQQNRSIAFSSHNAIDRDFLANVDCYNNFLKASRALIESGHDTVRLNNTELDLHTLEVRKINRFE